MQYSVSANKLSIHIIRLFILQSFGGIGLVPKTKSKETRIKTLARVNTKDSGKR